MTRNTSERRLLAVGLAVPVCLLLHSVPTHAGTLTCLTGTDVGVANDVTEITAVRALIDSACRCSSFTGSAGRTRADYIKCAKGVIAAQAAAGALRSQCVGTVKKFYATATCGLDPALQAVPCVTANSKTGKVSCAIKPAAKCVGGTAKTAKVGCANFTTCIDATDPNHDLIASGLCPDGAQCTLAATNIDQQLSQVELGGDGVTSAATVGGRQCRQMVSNTPGRFMYFKVSDTFIASKETGVSITVEYAATAPGQFVVNYDSSDFSAPANGAYKNTGLVTVAGDGIWRTATFRLPDAFFGNRENGGTDFRIYRNDDPNFDLCIGRVMVTRAPRCGDGIVEPGEECDDGNLIKGDGCDGTCRIDHCVTPGAGDNTAQLQAVLDAGSNLVLCRQTTYLVSSTLQYQSPLQEIYTLGLPTAEAQQGRLESASSSADTGIVAADRVSGVRLHHVTIDGMRSAFGRPVDGGPGLVEFNQVENGYVGYNHLHDPRGWSTLATKPAQLCQGTTIEFNDVGPAGQPDGTWADGISYACNNGEVAHNTITDATDGAIVIFGGAGSRVHDNTIRAVSRRLLGGINMVDHDPAGPPPEFSIDFTGTEVYQNTIRSDGARIKVAMGMGPMVWGMYSCAVGMLNEGANVHNNDVTGSNFGFGYVLNGVRNWQFSNNTAEGTFSGSPQGCSGNVAAPRAFACQVETVNNGACPSGTDVITKPANLDGVIYPSNQD